MTDKDGTTSDDNAISGFPTTPTERNGRQMPDNPNKHLEEMPVVNDKPKFLVGLGASAGGLEAIEAFFENVPPKSGLSFVLVQHLSPDFRSLMDEILARHTDMEIYRVENEMQVKKNAIYLIPPKKNMIVASGKLLLTDQEKTQGLNLPIDAFFRSLAQDYRNRSIAIILSGTGSDGSRGIRDIHEVGGFVISQDEESAGFDGMPRAAVKTGMVDLVLPPGAMPDAVLQYIRSPEKRAEGISLLPALSFDQPELHDIFELLRLRYGIEFKYYKPSTVDRRIERRMSITHCENLTDYVNYLTQMPVELDNLYHDLLIGVTRFFRDAPAFELLEKEIIPKVAGHKQPEDEIRVWLPGCATGEEAYSVAMLLHEFTEKHKISAEIKLFATDIHQASLDKAAAGVFSDRIQDDISIKRLKKFFTKKDDKYTVSRELRKLVIFAPQNVMSDPPFTNLDLVVCRNLLIYLDPSVQKKVYSLFHFALHANGYLFLGPSESLSGLEDEFDLISNQWKVYKKRRDVRLPDSRPLSVTRPAMSRVITGNHSRFRRQTTNPIESTITWAYESLLQEFAHTGFLIDEHFELFHIFGDASSFIKPREGRATNNLISIVDPHLSSALSAALHRANNEGQSVLFKDIKIDDAKEQKLLSIMVKPLRNRRSNKLFYFIGIENIGTKPLAESDPITVEVDSHAIQQIRDLESELQYTKEHLQATNEELEASNEELQASNEELLATNEELQSTNEELQSTNEELQSTNEELHSVNEELHTVNIEYQHKIEELVQLNNDVENLLTGTEIGTVFLDKSLRIRKFTAAATSVVNILDRDIGRPFQDISHRLKIEKHELIELIENVIENDAGIEKELEIPAEQWLLMRALPYHNEKATVDGVVLTFIDITLIKQTTTELARLVKKLESTNQELRDFAYVASHDLQAPLRQIAGFIDLLDKKEATTLDSDVKEYFGYVKSAAFKMSRLVDGLLQYSRINTRGGEFVSTACDKILNGALEFLADDISSRSAIILHTAMPKLKIDSTQLTRVFVNLIENALKYNKSKPPKIEISVEHENDEWIFSVKDNGIGIDPVHFDKVFVIFKRLHSDSDYPGTGLGLAITKRIIERHNGRIWLESKPGKGSIFYFALPVSETHPYTEKAPVAKSEKSTSAAAL